MTKLLQFIGKGQITIPQSWRALLGMEGNAVKATLEGNKIIIETLCLDHEENWNTEHISLNELSKTDQKIIKEGRKAYKAGKNNKFLAISEFFKN